MPELTFDFKKIAPRVIGAIQGDLRESAGFLSEGYKGRVHVKVISPFFQGKGIGERQAYIFELLRSKLDTDAQAVTLVTVYSPDEL